MGLYDPGRSCCIRLGKRPFRYYYKVPIMRAKEFIKEAGQLSLGNALRSMMAQAQKTQQSQAKDLNATQKPQSTQGTQGSVAPNQATSGGTQTPQNGTSKVASGPAGIASNFISGLTGGKADSLSGMAKQGVKGFVSNTLKMPATAAAASAPGADAPTGVFAKQPTPADLSAAFKAGNSFDIPNVGKVTVTKAGPQGLELDTSKASGLGVPKITVNPKDLLKK